MVVGLRVSPLLPWEFHGTCIELRGGPLGGTGFHVQILNDCGASRVRGLELRLSVVGILPWCDSELPGSWLLVYAWWRLSR